MPQDVLMASCLYYVAAASGHAAAAGDLARIRARELNQVRSLLVQFLTPREIEIVAW
jgi:hypothetical protein